MDSVTKQARFIKLGVNYKKSKGNFIVDADDNTILDCVNTPPLGYNHEII